MRLFTELAISPISSSLKSLIRVVSDISPFANLFMEFVNLMSGTVSLFENMFTEIITTTKPIRHRSAATMETRFACWYISFLGIDNPKAQLLLPSVMVMGMMLLM